MKLTRAVKCFLLLALGSILMPGNSYALIFAKTDSDYVFINSVKTTIEETGQSETLFSIGDFDKLVILTEQNPIVYSPSVGLFTVYDVSDAVWQKNGQIAYSSSPDCIPACSVTFGFDPRRRGPAFERGGREGFLSDGYAF